MRERKGKEAERRENKNYYGETPERVYLDRTSTWGQCWFYLIWVCEEMRENGEAGGEW